MLPNCGHWMCPIWFWLFSRIANIEIMRSVPEVIAMFLHHSFHGREIKRRARDRVSRKRMYLEEKRDTMKLRRAGNRANGLANNFVSVSQALSFVILPSHPSSLSFHLLYHEVNHLFLFIICKLPCLFSTRSPRRSVRTRIIRSWTAVTYVVHFVIKQRRNQYIVLVSLKVSYLSLSLDFIRDWDL